MYYTSDHEWIEFQGTTACVGISSFKLIGFKAIDEIIFNEPLSYKKRGDIVAWIQYKDYKIEVHMPVDGSIVQVNKKLLGKDPGQIFAHLSKSGWIFAIIPTNRYERNELIPIKDYLPLIRNEFPNSLTK
jgi:glycine cleavage system H protein